MSVDATDARSAANAHAADHQDDVRTPPLSPSVSASAAAAANGGSQFWCHECDANVATRVDEATDEVCCQRCGGNFVEEVEAVRWHECAVRSLVRAAICLCSMLMLLYAWAGGFTGRSA